MATMQCHNGRRLNVFLISLYMSMCWVDDLVVCCVAGRMVLGEAL